MSSAPVSRGPRLREFGLRIGELETGPADAITDVRGVQVGHVTVWRDEPAPPRGRGVARTGVTAILPGLAGELFREPVPAGAAVLNGAGEMTGYLQVSEWGLIETPVYLTSTMAVGRVFDGAVATAVAADPAVGTEDVVIPVVAECDDSWLSDSAVVQVEAADSARAVREAAGGDVAEGAVGAGTGMVCFGWKGGIGTASRLVPELGAVVGVLVLARVARRAGLGLARTGSAAHHGSGEIFLAFSTGSRVPRGRAPGGSVPDDALNPLFTAVVDVTEEAVLNALWAGAEVTGRRGRVTPGLPHDRVLELLREHGRLQ